MSLTQTGWVELFNTGKNKNSKKEFDSEQIEGWKEKGILDQEDIQF
jgi:hypothetical protein